MNVNWETVILALKISGAGILVLLLVLALLAGIVSLLTRFIKDAPEEEDAGDADETVDTVVVETNDHAKIAVMAVAIARAQSEFSVSTKSDSMSLNSWGQFHLSRRLNLSSSIRRSK